MIDLKTTKTRTNINFILLIAIITIISLINLYSASHSLVSIKISKVFMSQVIWFIIGWLLFLTLTFINFNFIKRLTWPIYFINIGFLILVQIIGKSFYGAQRWIDFGLFRFQPSETMKITLVLALAAILSKNLLKPSLNLKDLILPIILVLAPFTLTVIQPDLGTSLVMIAIASSMVLFVGINKRILISAFVIGSLSLPIIWNYGLKKYQKQRIYTFLNPGKDIRGGGYNSRQSKIAVGSGLLLGRGYRKGTQSQLEFLPERHTDFIFSVLSEEHGFIGCIVIILLFLFLFLNIINIAQFATDPYETLVCIGVGGFIFWHFFINISMITGILPIVGLPLPLLSYGGSSILTSMIGLGLISSIARKKNLFS